MYESKFQVDEVIKCSKYAGANTHTYTIPKKYL